MIVPGGGKGDLWQGLNCKGKYAGELRIELTYYDSRPKPDGAESVYGQDDIGRSLGSGPRVKRRPLPSNPNSGHVTPDSIPQYMPPVRAKHGPRDLRTPPRANSMPPEGFGPQTVVHVHHYDGSMHQAPPDQYYQDYDHFQEPQEYGDAPYGQPQQPDLLPELPPSHRQQVPLPAQPRMDNRNGQGVPQPRPQSHIGIPPSYSAPVIPHSHPEPSSYEENNQLQLAYPEPIPDLEYQHQQLDARQRRNDVPPSWQSEYGDPYENRLPYGEEETSAPPPPPMHSNSAPVVPHYASSHNTSASLPSPAPGRTPPNARHHSIPAPSPLQTIERKYVTPQRPSPHGNPPRGMSMDGYTPSPEQRQYGSSPSSFTQGQTPSPLGRSQPVPRPLPNRNSIADPYTPTPPRQHPLSQEVPRPRSPLPYSAQGLPESSPLPHGQLPYQEEYRSRDGVPLVRPRAISPQISPQRAESSPQVSSAPRPRNSYSIQNPIRAFESSDHSPLSNSRPALGMVQTSSRSNPMRKSVSPHPTPPNSAGAIPFSPDSFDIHNPNARQSNLGGQVSPHNPYQVRPGSDAVPRDEANGTIKNWHGQEIDPSDHLPVDSWAPEPEKKIPTRTYGLGRDRDFGPRTVQSGTGSGSRNLSKDTVVNMRSRAQTNPEPEVSPSRNRLQKKSGQGKSPVPEPLRERHNYNSVSVPNPYEQQEYGRGFYHADDRGGYDGYGSPSASPADALSREISNIDIGSARHQRTGSVPAPTAYVPVRSHKDRTSFY